MTGLPVRLDRPVLRVGALVTYTVSAEEFYQERLECWIDAVSGLRLGADDVTRLQRAPRLEGPVAALQPVLAAVTGALEQAHRILDAADRRRSTLPPLRSQAGDAAQPVGDSNYRRGLGYPQARRSLR